MNGFACPRPRPRPRDGGVPLPRNGLSDGPRAALLPPRPELVNAPPLSRDIPRGVALVKVAPRARGPRVPPSLEVDMVADERQTRSDRHVEMGLSLASGLRWRAHGLGVWRLCRAARVFL